MSGPLRAFTFSIAVLLIGSCSGSGGLGELGGVPQDCIDLNNLLNGTWHESNGVTASSFPETIRFRKVTEATGRFDGFGETLDYSISEECDAILIIDGAGQLVITYNVSRVNGWLVLENWNRAHSYWKEGAEPDCPTSITVNRVVPVSLAQWKLLTGEDLLTGVGAFVAMEVHPAKRPSGGSWNGVVMTEKVWQVSDSCDLAGRLKRPGFPCTCGTAACNATFTVGAKFAGTPAGLADAEDNVFWDFHFVRDNDPKKPVSLLHLLKLRSCTADCGQSYSCDGNEISTHTITYTFERNDTTGTTDVSVTKR